MVYVGACPSVETRSLKPSPDVVLRTLLKPPPTGSLATISAACPDVCPMIPDARTIPEASHNPEAIACPEMFGIMPDASQRPEPTATPDIWAPTPLPNVIVPELTVI